MKHRVSRRAIGAGALGAGALALLWSVQSQGGSDGHAEASTGESMLDFRQRPIEGGRVVLDRARFPTRFQEAPELADMVRQGLLPAVEERIGQDPLVIEPLHEIGQYGGVLRRGFTGPGDTPNAYRFAGPDSLLFWNADWSELRPNIARDFSVSRDGRVTTVFLRRGMRWSDGTPFTADDILFWHEDMYDDQRVISQRAPALQIGGKDVRVRKLDQYTVEYLSPEPYFLFPEMLAGVTDIGGPSLRSSTGFGGFAPKHYLSRFHPKYRSEDAILKEARDNGFAGWPIYLRNRFDWTLNTELPVVSPWHVTTPINRLSFELKRNPYSIWVDTAGNQLPYIGSIVHRCCADGKAVTAAAAVGAFDFQERHLQIGSLPFLLRNRDRIKYQVYLNPAEGADLSLRLNLDYRPDPEIGALLADTTFRRALSLGINRQQINETFVLGAGLPTAAVPAPNNRFYPGDEWARRWATYDPQQANRMLDAMGLTERDRQGFRLRRDRAERVRLVCTVLDNQFDNSTVSEMVRGHWRDIGVDLETKIEEPNLIVQHAMAGEIQMQMHFTVTEDPFTYPELLFPFSRSITSAIIGLDFARWFQTNGEEGKRPPEEIVQIMQLWRRGRVAPLQQRLELGKEIIRRHVDQVLTIGLISNGLANYGIHIASEKLRNVPRRVVNTNCLRSPAAALPMTFYYRDNA